MRISRDFSVSVKAGLLTGLFFVVFQQPLALTVSWTVRWVAGALYQPYVDYLYRLAASGGTESHLGFAILSLLDGIFVMAPFGGVVGVWLMHSRLRRMATAPNPAAVSPLPGISLRGMLRGLTALMLVLALIGQVELSSFYFSLRITTRFEQHMHILAPLIPDQEAKVFWSRWSRIETESDYDALYSDINQIAAANGIHLRIDSPVSRLWL